MNSALTIQTAFEKPDLLHFQLAWGTGDIIYRPLVSNDLEALTEFMVSLSTETRHFWLQNSYDRATAQELCAAIGRYDKLRLVAIPAKGATRLLALFEFSLGIPQGDLDRFAANGLPLDERTDCRFGPCVRDELRGTGLAHALMPPTLETAHRFGKRRVILWGGVLVENQRAMRFYARGGFREVGRFTNSDGNACIDMLIELDNHQPLV